MALPQYETKMGDESAWAGIVAATFSVVSLGLLQVHATPEFSIACGTLVGSLVRLVAGRFLPSPPLPEP
jgi:hypothetical protein